MVALTDVRNMFWGVTLEGSGKRYTQTVEHTFHISMAALEHSAQGGAQFVSVMIQHEKAEFLLCTLQHGKHLQQPLDLNFTEGEEVTFFLNGNGTVHLTGYLVEDEQVNDESMLDMEAESSEEELSSDNDLMDEEEEEDSDEDDDEDVPYLKALAGVAVDEDDSDEDEDDDYQPETANNSKRKLKEKGSQKKRAKIVELDDDDEEDDDEEDSDEDEEDDDDAGLEFPEVDFEAEEEEGDSTGSYKQEEEPTKKKKKKKKKKQKEAQNDKKPQETVAAKQESPKQKQNEATPSTKKDKKKNKQKDQASEKKSEQKKKPESGGKGDAKKTPKKTVKAGGIVAEEVKVGNGPDAKSGKMAHVYYTGRLNSGKMFDSCISGKPFKFRLGKGEVIKGWDVGLEGMKVGGKRKLTIPPQQGYGSQRSGPIPPNSVLVFEVELKGVS